jgi:hypothetical protein
MSTFAPSGLTSICAVLGVSRNLLQFLLRSLGPQWRANHPDRPVGRPRRGLTVLLAGTLAYLRDGTTFARAGARSAAGFHAARVLR